MLDGLPMDSGRVAGVTAGREVARHVGSTAVWPLRLPECIACDNLSLTPSLRPCVRVQTSLYMMALLDNKED